MRKYVHKQDSPLISDEHPHPLIHPPSVQPKHMRIFGSGIGRSDLLNRNSKPNPAEYQVGSAEFSSATWTHCFNLGQCPTLAATPDVSKRSIDPTLLTNHVIEDEVVDMNEVFGFRDRVVMCSIWQLLPYLDLSSASLIELSHM